MKAALNFFFFWKGKRGFTQIEIEYWKTCFDLSEMNRRQK